MSRPSPQADFREYYEKFRNRTPLSAKDERRLLHTIQGLGPPREEEIEKEIDTFLGMVELGLHIEEDLPKQPIPGETDDICSVLDQLLGYRVHPTNGEVQTAWKKFIVHNMRLVLSRVLRFRSQNDPNAMELVSYGTDGLLRAIELFDLSRNVRFSTYAVHWIDSFIRKGLEFIEGQKAPLAKQLTRDYKKGEKILTDKTGARPTSNEVAELIGWSNTTLSAYQSSSISNVPVEICDAEDDSGPPIPISAINTETFAALHEAMGVLDPHEEEIIRRHYGLGYKEETLQSLADMFGVTKERIRQIENDGLKKLYLEIRHHRPLDD